ncbi:hypothetical protein M885DRAFT_485907 [Pelagophyceae sp. CCMP2097]|nr:hypothetical protein M885DRAFT_485907 [Pelagophyceae sp. CCMP2097]|mmetsp:Transcript_23512/g.80301  ORF Transcript_23512/g.80301 Transcript_23512/m.80301 type:complete len:549 (+) Transcript_23512:49-1695(+)
MRLLLLAGMLSTRLALRLGAPIRAASGLHRPGAAVRTSAVVCRAAGRAGSYAGDTIFALSSGRGVAGVAVIRVSGGEARSVLQSLLGDSKEPPVRYAGLRTLKCPNTGEALDEAVVLRFEGPKSFTGEDIVELHVHGGAATIEGVLDALSTTKARPAERGEFTRRAFQAGKLGVTEVEGLADLLCAESQQQRRQALSVMGGRQAALYDRWRAELVSCRAWAEAAVDFGDDTEGDVDATALTGADGGVLDRVRMLRGELRDALRDGVRGEAVRDGVRVVLAGAPNAGKSSVLNALAGRDAAIVSAEAGTTRDVVEVAMKLGGLPVLLFDTAGLRENAEDAARTVGAIEAEGIRRTQAAAQKAHVVVFVIDASEAAVAREATVALELLKGALRVEPQPHLVVLANKADVGRTVVSSAQDLRELCETPIDADIFAALNAAPWLQVSATQQTGLDAVVSHLDETVARLFGGDSDTASPRQLLSDAPAITRARHRYHVENALEALDSALQMDLATELRAEELRTASVELGRVVGAIDVENVLDVLFRDFCIGK